MFHNIFTLSRTTCVLFPIIAAGCGPSSDPSSTASSSPSSQSPSSTAPESQSPSVPSAIPTSLVFKGSIESAFAVTVDGKSYKDMEDFYTQELGQLPAQVKAAGYTDDYQIRFDAQVGLSDLWTDMTVYIAATKKRGYQGQGQVAQDGSFTLQMPQDANDETYQVRANKRIGVVLTKGDQVTQLCYNFSAADQSVLFSDKEKPIILSQFQSALTKYACAPVAAGGGLSVPKEAAASSIPAAAKLRKGMSKDQVLAVFGSDEMTVDSTTKWCWHAANGGPAKACAVDFASSCQCSVSFDDQGNAVSQDNINGTLLDILSW